MKALIVLVGAIISARFLTVIFHELGHAVPAILLTRKKVTIYLGTYGDPQKSFRINTPFLELFFYYNLLTWRGALCVPSASEMSLWKQGIYVVSGPLASLLVTIAAGYFAFTYDLGDALKVWVYFFAFSAVFDLTNLIPDSKPIVLYNGTVTYNDGYALSSIIGKMRGKMTADELFNEGYNNSTTGNYEKALEYYELALKVNPDHLFALNNKACTFNFMGKYDEALRLFDKVIEMNATFADPFVNRGLSKIKLGRVEEGLADINHGLELDPNNSYGYRNLGIYHFDRGEYQEAMRLFTKAKDIDGTTTWIDKLIHDTEKKLNIHT